MQTGIYTKAYIKRVIINLTQSLIESLYLGIDYVQKLILKITLKKFKRLKFYIFLFFEIFVFQ